MAGQQRRASRAEMIATLRALLQKVEVEVLALEERRHRLLALIDAYALVIAHYEEMATAAVLIEAPEEFREPVAVVPVPAATEQTASDAAASDEEPKAEAGPAATPAPAPAAVLSPTYAILGVVRGLDSDGARTAAEIGGMVWAQHRLDVSRSVSALLAQNLARQSGLQRRRDPDNYWRYYWQEPQAAPVAGGAVRLDADGRIVAGEGEGDGETVPHVHYWRYGQPANGVTMGECVGRGEVKTVGTPVEAEADGPVANKAKAPTWEAAVR